MHQIEIGCTGDIFVHFRIRALVRISAFTYVLRTHTVQYVVTYKREVEDRGDRTYIGISSAMLFTTTCMSVLEVAYPTTPREQYARNED